MVKFIVGDIVRVVWKDHYRTHNADGPPVPMLVESYGRVGEVSEEVVLLHQNRVINLDVIKQMPFCTSSDDKGHFAPLHECMDGQFIVRDCIVEVCVLVKAVSE